MKSLSFSSLTRRASQLATTGTAIFILTAAGLAPAPAMAGPDEEIDLYARICLIESLAEADSQACIDRHGIKRPWLAKKLAQLYRSVRPFYNHDVARAAGWDTPISDCVESPAGGMGYHVANLEQLNSGELSLLRPQVLLYSPAKDGSMQFHGVEYIIPADLWNESEPPKFLGRKLRFNPNVPPNGIWALHVWVGTENPRGVFADFNPRVKCKYAQD